MIKFKPIRQPIHETLIALLNSLPNENDKWDRDKKERFILAFETTINLLYPDEKGELNGG